MTDLINLLRKIKPVSDFSTRKEWEAAVWDELLTIIQRSDSRKDLSFLLSILTTNSERKHIVMRAAAIARIIQGASYRTIGKELWLSPQTISAIRKGLRERHYVSRYTRDSRGDKERKRKKNLKQIAKQDARKDRIRPYRRTKYGRVYY